MTRVKLVGGSWDQEVVEVQEWASTLDTPIKENKKRDRYLIEKEYNRGLYTGEVDQRKYNVELSGGAGNDDGSPEGTPRSND